MYTLLRPAGNIPWVKERTIVLSFSHIEVEWNKIIGLAFVWRTVVSYNFYQRERNNHVFFILNTDTKTVVSPATHTCNLPLYKKTEQTNQPTNQPIENQTNHPSRKSFNLFEKVAGWQVAVRAVQVDLCIFSSYVENLSKKQNHTATRIVINLQRVSTY